MEESEAKKSGPLEKRALQAKKADRDTWGSKNLSARKRIPRQQVGGMPRKGEGTVLPRESHVPERIG